MAEAGSLAKFTPEWAEDVKGLSKENGYSWSYEIQPKLLVCNPDVYTEETAPKSYQDLWEKRISRKIRKWFRQTFDGNTKPGPSWAEFSSVFGPGR